MKILGTGSAFPERVVTNHDLAKIVDTSDEWITSRTGIEKRRISTGEKTSELAGRAAEEALESAGVKPEEIDLILLATMSGEQIMPNLAAVVQQKIGAVNATCFDINAACSGFLYALNTANAYLMSHMYRKILVIGAETLSRLVDWEDRTTCVLFGDGAGAVVVTADEKKYVSVSGSDGEKGEVLTAGRMEEEQLSMIRMNGQEVFKFAVKTVPEAIHQLLDKAGVAIDEVDYFLLHQANVRIIASVAKRLEVAMDKMPVNLNRYGNTSAASIPILLDEVWKSGKVKEGQKIVLAGFGGGLTWGAAYLEL